jgi:hypothetical protein
MKILNNLDLLKNELRNAAIQNLGDDPQNAVLGQIYFNTVSKELKICSQVTPTIVWDVVGKEYYVAVVEDSGVKIRLSDSNSVNDDIKFVGAGGITVTKVASEDTIQIEATGVSTPNSLVIKFDTGETEGTDLYTFNGSAAKTVDIVAGNLMNLDVEAGEVSINHNSLTNAYGTTADTETTLTNVEILSDLTVDSAGHVSAGTFRKFVAGTNLAITAGNTGNITFDHATITRTDPSATTASPAFNGTFTIVDGVTTSNGHVTAVATKVITLPTETTLSLVDNGTGTWITGVAVNNHAVTVSRSNTTTAKITVGELEIVKADEVSNGNLTVGGDVTITGDLTVNGTMTTLNTETVKIEDNIILINGNQTGNPASSLVSGIEVERGDLPNFQFVFVENTDDFRLGKVGSDLQAVLTRDDIANLAEGDILVWDATNKKAIGKTYDELTLPNKYAVTLTDIAQGQTYTVTHNLNTEDVVVSLRDAATKEMVQADITITGVNTLTVSLGYIGAVEDLRVVVVG